MYSCETVWVKVILSKGWMIAVRNYSIYKHYNGKKKKQGEGSRFKDDEFSGVK